MISKCYALAIAFLLPCFSVHAENIGDYWQCKTRDSSNQEWVAVSKYERLAVNKAFDSCKKESSVPLTCKTSTQDCETYINGQSTSPLWRCTALDRTATPWQGRLYQHRDDAALAAKDYCQQNSSLPETCYVNTVTCINKNESL